MTTVSTLDEWVDWAQKLTNYSEIVDVAGPLADQLRDLAGIHDRSGRIRGAYTYDHRIATMVAVFDVFTDGEPSPRNHLGCVDLAVNAQDPASVEALRARMEDW